MRNIPAALQAHLQTGATTLCYIWTLTRKDGAVFGFTDHDCDLRIDGVDYLAASGMGGGSAESVLGFAVDNAAVQSLLSDARLTPRDIQAGLYDGAVLRCAIVNWQDPLQRLDLARGLLGEITQKGAQFEAEWIGEGVKLNRSMGRVFSRICDADFGDARCGLNPANFAEGTRCPRSFAACKDRFNNAVNFRGFPYLLGTDVLTAAPREADSRDGGSRYQAQFQAQTKASA